MINFPPLRTKRFTAELQELTIGQGIAIAGMSPQFPQAEATAFLRAVVKPGSGNGELSDPINWTVQERIFTICHYIASTSEEGPDFSVGQGHYSDYIDAAKDADIPESAALGEVAGDEYAIHQLTGRMAESIERLLGEVKDTNGQPLPVRMHWIVGGMAAQLQRVNAEAWPPAEMATDGAYDDWLLKRINVFCAFPEADFWSVALAYLNGRSKLSHLLNIDFSNDGIVVLPNEGGAAADLPPARFPARACLSALTLGMG